jgi:hypothetical protein
MKVYLNKAFLVNFLLADSGNDLHFYIHRYISSSASGAEIIVDFDFEEAYNDPTLRPIVRQIAGKVPVTNTSFIQDCRNPEFYNNSEGHLFFVDNETNTDIVEEFGCFITDSTNLQKGAVMFYIEDFRINSKHQDWAVLGNLKHPCNALVISDNYLLSSDSGFENLASILKNVMPKNLHKDLQFHLTIIGFDPKKAFQPIQKHYDQIKTFLEQNYTYSVNLSIIREDHHGRYIHSNSYRVFCERGFDLFTKRKISRNKETSVLGIPLTNFGNSSNSEETRKEEITFCKKIAGTDRMPDKFAGNKINRLLM